MSNGPDPSELYNVAEFEQAARELLPGINFGRVAGGSGSNSTVRANAAAFDRWRFLRRVLVDVSERDLSVELLGRRISLPIVVAPQNQQVQLHPDGEPATARAAAAAGIPMGVSMGANHSIEAIAEAADTSLWFQPYAVSDRRVMGDLIRRSRDAGYDAICVTVDAPINGWRETDMRGRPVLPDGAEWPNMPEEFRPGAGRWLDTSRYDWDELDWLIANADLPVIVKGLMHPDDATRAADAGVAAVVVSNHGGRQLGEEVAALDALPAVAAAVGNRIDVMVDGGITRGTHIVTALALGAKAVLLGRAVSWGLAVGGEAGVSRVLQLLRGELDSAVANLGLRSVAEIGPDVLVPAGLTLG